MKQPLTPSTSTIAPLRVARPVLPIVAMAGTHARIHHIASTELEAEKP